MARLRTIKPGFFTNDELVGLDPLARILFAGLWCWADREGRLEDRPGKIKLEILPGDACDVDALLDALAGRGFIVRYEADGKRYLSVTNFSEHQNPHVKEAASRIPAPPEHQTCTVLAPDKHDASTTGILILGSGIRSITSSEASVAVAAAPPPAPRRSVRPAPKPKEREKSWIETHPLFAPLTAIPSIGRPAGDEWSRFGKAINTLVEKGATPEEVPRRAENYPLVMGCKEDGTPLPLTLTSLVKNWHLCATAPQNGTHHGQVQVNRADLERRRIQQSEERGRILGALREEIIRSAGHDTPSHPVP